MFSRMSKPLLGFLQASGLVGYIVLISTFLNNIPKIFNNGSWEIMAPIMMLLLFVISAVISALLVLGRAGVLFWEKKYSDAFTLVAWTIGWGILYFVLLLVFLFVM